MNWSLPKVLALCGLILVLAAGCAAARGVAGAQMTATAAPALEAVATTAEAPKATAAPIALSTPTLALPTRPVFTDEGISGKVMWGADPVPGMRVELRKSDWRANPRPDNVVASALTGPGGAFVIENPPAGEWSLCAVWPDGEESTAGTPVVQVAAGQVISETVLPVARKLQVLEPAPGTRVAAEPTLRWQEFPGLQSYRVLVLDAGTTELLVQKEITGTVLHVTPALKPGRKYQVSIAGFGADHAQLANGDSEFWVEGADPTPTPGNQETEGLPPSCRSGNPEVALYVGPERYYCFLYPARFKPGEFGPGQPGVFGPALDQSPDPLRAALQIEITPAPAGATLSAVVDEFLKEFAGIPGGPITRTETIIASEPAQVLEVVPGRTGSRDAIVLQNGLRYRLLFMPSVRDFPAAKADVEELFDLVTGSFTILYVPPDSP